MGDMRNRVPLVVGVGVNFYVLECWSHVGDLRKSFKHVGCYETLCAVAAVSIRETLLLRSRSCQTKVPYSIKIHCIRVTHGG